MAKIAKSEYHCLLFLLYRSRLAGNLKSRRTATRDESWSCDEWISISVLLAIPFRYCTKLPGVLFSAQSREPLAMCNMDRRGRRLSRLEETQAQY